MTLISVLNQYIYVVVLTYQYKQTLHRLRSGMYVTLGAHLWTGTHVKYSFNTWVRGMDGAGAACWGRWHGPT